jgi:hypothetical protein
MSGVTMQIKLMKVWLCGKAEELTKTIVTMVKNVIICPDVLDIALADKHFCGKSLRLTAFV